MAGEFNITGLVNGFDMNSILQQIQLIKSQQIYMLQQQQQQISDKKTVISNIQSILKNLQNVTNSLTDTSTLNAKSINISNPNVLNATITDSNSITEGIFDINITNFAKNQVYSSTNSISNKDSALGLTGGTLTITMNGLDYNVGYDNTYSLQNLADEINSVANTYNGNFRASVINVGTSSNPQYKLVISGTKTGSENGFSISDTGGAVSTLGINSIQNAQNGTATVNGIDIESDTNTFTNIPGLSFTALQTGSTTLKVEKDNKPITDALSSIVNLYNQLVDVVSRETGRDGKLSGEYGLNIVVSGIFRQLDPLFIQDIIKFDRTTGKISLNNSKLEETLNSDPSSLRNTLNDVKNDLTEFLSSYIQYNGILDQYNKSYDNQIKNIQDIIDLQTKRIQGEIEILKNQFIKMQMIQAQMNDIGLRIQSTFFNNKQ